MNMERKVSKPETRKKLEDCVSFLTHRINARLQQVCNPVLAPLKLDLYSSRIIAALSERPEMKVGEFVELMALPQSTISHQLKRMEHEDCLLRTRSLTDNRTVVVTLTDRGKDVAKTCDALSDHILGAVSTELSDDEIEHLSSLLKRMFASLPEDGSINPENSDL